MRKLQIARIRIGMAFLGGLLLSQAAWAHVTLQVSQPLHTKGFATATLNVPNERYVNNTKVSLEVPDAFLKAGGRVNRVLYPPGWTVTLEKQDKPSEVMQKEKDERGKRDTKKEQNPDHDIKAGKTNEDKQEKKAMDELRKKWITKVTFEAAEGAAIPPDGFQAFQISFQLPDEPGKFRFATVQTYADGKEVSWSELVEGAEHPAPTLAVNKPPSFINYGSLPLPLSGLAVLISLAGILANRSRASKKMGEESPVLAGGRLANA